MSRRASASYYGYIYKSENLVNGMMYIGQRKGEFKANYFGSGRRLQRALKKYGPKNFSVQMIHTASDMRNLNELEKELIASYRREFGKVRLYNLDEGGLAEWQLGGSRHDETIKKISHSHIGIRPSKETREKLRQYNLGKPAWNKGIPLSPEVKENLRKANLGKHLSEEQKAKIVAAWKQGRMVPPPRPKYKGSHLPEEYKAKISATLMGHSVSEDARKKMSAKRKGKKRKPHSEETKRKMSAAKKGITFTEEHRRKLSESHTGKTPWNKNMKGITTAWNKGIPMRPESRAKLSASLTGHVPWNKGRRGILSGSKNPFFGKKHSEATREKMSLRKLGVTWSPARRAAEKSR